MKRDVEFWSTMSSGEHVGDEVVLVGVKRDVAVALIGGEVTIEID
jgi:hypothetical protein